MKRLLLMLTFTVGASILGQANPPGLWLSLDAYGPHSYVTWRAREGLPDRHGKGNFAVEFEIDASTSYQSAARAVVLGIRGLPVSFLTQGPGVSWERRNDGDCGRRSPYWYLIVKGANGEIYKLILACQDATHSPGSEDGWAKDSFGGADLGLRISQEFGSMAPDVLEGTIWGLGIYFDTGTDQGLGYVYLDNIEVNGRRWGSPAENGR